MTAPLRSVGNRTICSPNAPCAAAVKWRGNPYDLTEGERIRRSALEELYETDSLHTLINTAIHTQPSRRGPPVAFRAPSSRSRPCPSLSTGSTAPYVSVGTPLAFRALARDTVSPPRYVAKGPNIVPGKIPGQPVRSSNARLAPTNRLKILRRLGWCRPRSIRLTERLSPRRKELVCLASRGEIAAPARSRRIGHH